MASKVNYQIASHEQIVDFLAKKHLVLVGLALKMTRWIEQHHREDTSIEVDSIITQQALEKNNPRDSLEIM